MSNHFEKYLIHPIERPITDADPKVVLISSKDNPIMSFFYESCFYRHPCVIADRAYALPDDEFFCFVSTNGSKDRLGATISMEINGQKFVTDRCCMIQIPAFVPHGPIEITEMTTPIFSYCTAISPEHRALPEANWRPQDCPALEDMIVYANGHTIKDEYDIFNQHWQIRGIPGRTMKAGSLIGSLRRFYDTDGWVYIDEAHMHLSPELLCYYGTDPWHPYELGGEYQQGIGGELYTFSKPTAVFVPGCVPHCPIVVKKVDKENIWHSCGQSVGPVNNKYYENGYFANMNARDEGVEMPEAW